MTLADSLLGRPTVLALARLRAWPVDSQHRARRNAMIAATACAQRRAERLDVAEYFATQHDSGQHDPGQHDPSQHDSGQHDSGQHDPGWLPQPGARRAHG